MDFDKLKRLFGRRTQTRVSCEMTVVEDAIYCGEGLITSLEYCYFNQASNYVLLEDALPTKSEIDLDKY